MEIKRRALAMSRREFAALAPKIYELAEGGDLAALSLYEQAATEIVSLAYAVSEPRENFKILLCGGFFAQKPLLLQLCREKLARISPATPIYEPRFSPIAAAQLAVLQSDGIPVTDELFSILLNN